MSVSRRVPLLLPLLLCAATFSLPFVAGASSSVVFTDLVNRPVVLEAVTDVFGAGSIERVGGTLCDNLPTRFSGQTIILATENRLCDISDTSVAVIQVVVGVSGVSVHFKPLGHSAYASARVPMTGASLRPVLQLALSSIETHTPGISIPSLLLVFFGVVVAVVGDRYFRKSEVSSALELQRICGDVSRAEKWRDNGWHEDVPVKAADFRRCMHLLTEFIINYLEHPDVYEVTTRSKPGFLFNSLPKTAPVEPEPFENILRDLYTKILPGMTHWQHPNFLAYFPHGCSYGDVLGEALASGLGVVSFSWDAAPSITELEISMVNWVGRLFGLPETFLFSSDANTSSGGGAMHSGASEAIMVAMMAARAWAISKMMKKDVVLEHRDEEHEILKKLVAYTSREAHSSVDKAALMCLVHLTSIKPDENFALRGDALEREIVRDLERGRKPFYVHATLGTTSVCSFDNLREITRVAKKYGLWVHVDSAYAGSAFVVPELRKFMDGIEDVDSININLHKLFYHTTSAAVLWTKDHQALKQAFTVHPTYLRAQHAAALDFRHLGIPLCRRAKCLKIWMITRLYGSAHMESYIRRLVACGAYFRNLVLEEKRLEIVGQPVLGLITVKVRCTSDQESTRLTKELTEYLNRTHKVVVTFAKPHGFGVMRISLAFNRMNEKMLDDLWRVLSAAIDEFFVLSSGPKSFRHLHDNNNPVGSPAVTTMSTQSTRSAASTNVHSPMLC